MRGILSILIAVAWVPSCLAEPVTLSAFLQRLRDQHPFLRKEALHPAIERKQQERFLGDQDWTASLLPSYSYDETVAREFGSPEEINNLHVNGGLERSIWRTGGRLGLSYDYDYSDATFGSDGLVLPGGEVIDVGGPPEFFENRVALTYTHPLWKNRGGQLDRLDYDLQGFTAEQAELLALENQEEFLRGLADRFLDWALLNEEKRIAHTRLDLAREELSQAERKLKENMVEKVDVLRARDAVFTAERNVKLVESLWNARRQELTVQTQWPALAGGAPDHDLYRLQDIPGGDEATRILLDRARVLRVVRLRLDQLDRQLSGFENIGKPNLDLVLTGGLKDGAEEAGDATGFDRPNVGVALAYRYPLGNRTARADVEKIGLQKRQAREEMQSIALELESSVRALITRIRELGPVLELNVKQIQTAADKTGEEQRLYEQGRNQLTFVIQSRDSEARAQLVYARNAAQYHAMVLQYRALMDELLRTKTPGSDVQ